MSIPFACSRCDGTGREPSKEHTTRAACWSCGGDGFDALAAAATVKFRGNYTDAGEVEELRRDFLLEREDVARKMRAER